MAKQILTGLDLLALPSLTTPKTGSIGFGAKSDGLYQKIGSVESKLSTTAELLDRVKTAVPLNAKFTDTIYSHPTGDGNLHVPVTGTTNNGKVLKAGVLPGQLAWGTDNDTITTINGKTGAITKADIVALGIPAQDTVYTHPTSHPATMITQTSSHRFVTDTEKSTWNAKSNLALGTTSATAYRGDLGAIAYNHSQSAHDYLPLAGGTLTGTATFNGGFRLNTPIQNYNPFSSNTIFDSIDTNLFAGKWNKIKVTANGVENITNTRYLFDQSYEQYSTTCGRDGDAPLVLNIDLIAKGLAGASGVTYASGFVLLNFYSSHLPATYTARVKNNAGVWTNMPLTAISSSQIKGTIPISLYITDIEFTFTTGVGAPYITGNYKWGLAEIEYHSTRMSLTQGGNITSVGGYIGGNLTIDGTLSASLSGNASSATTLQTARTINGTSFNGSANITTANWGTARNISIGGTSKSVNGSANITWATSEIAAQSAIQLATARNINGTSFNGTAAITTANWGTARNIGVVNSDGTGTAVTTSVNGSGNVNLRLPATIKASLTGNASTATTLATTRAINGTNFNGSAAITTANWGTARTLSFTGDVTGSSSVNGSANVATAMTLKNSGVTAGTYRSVTVDVKGRVTAGTNPTTVSGYGLTDAVTTNTTQSITGTKTFTQRIGANLGIKIGTHATNGLIEWDAANNAFKFNGSLYATGGVSALGLGDGGGSSGGGADMLDAWANYTEAKADYYVPSSLLVPFRNDALNRLDSLESDLNGKQATLIQGANITITGSTISAVNTTYGAVTTSANGLMIAADKVKLNGIAAGANNYVHPSGVYMSSAERTKLAGIATSANNYSLPTASASVLGGIMVGTRLSISNGVLSATQQTANDFTTVLKNKLDGIATGANNYTHPSSHPATIITQTASARFVTDAEKTNWNAKIDANKFQVVTSLPTSPTAGVFYFVKE